MRMYAIEESTGKCLIATSKLNLKVGFSCYELVSHEYGSNECIFYLHSADTLSPGTVLLFELREMAKECNNRPVAWAFFRPHRSVQLREKCQCLELQLFNGAGSRILYKSKPSCTFTTIQLPLSHQHMFSFYFIARESTSLVYN